MNLLTALILVLAQDFDPAKLEAIGPGMKGFVERKQAAGVVTLVGRRDGVVHHEAAGLRNLESAAPMEPDTIFQIASMTKPVTGMAIAMLEDEGKLSVDDPVEKHLPEFKGQLLVKSKTAEETVLVKPPRPITIRDLATHTGGQPGGPPPGLSDLYTRRHLTLAEATFAYSQMPLQFEPGAKWAYSNAGIDTLGRIVEVASGMSFESFLETRLFRPLGMKDTFFYPTEATLPRVATLYKKAGDGLAPAKNFLGSPVGGKFPLPAGGLFSTAPDMARICRLMLAKGVWEGKRILSEAGVEGMTRVLTGELKCGFTDQIGMGLGWQVVRTPAGPTAALSPGSYGHGGAFGTQYWIDPVKGTFTIMLVAREGFGNGDASDLRRTLQELALAALKK
ncbi:MAG TPA: serine hydrolase domain-containing protein [Planctomycetota bacterium]